MSMKGYDHQGVAASTGDVHAPTSNTAAIVTYAALPASSATSGGYPSGAHVITGVGWSYSAAPTGGNLKVEDGSGNVVFSADITAAGPGEIIFPLPKRGAANTAMVVTLAAGGGGITGKVSVLNHWTEGGSN